MINIRLSLLVKQITNPYYYYKLLKNIHQVVNTGYSGKQGREKKGRGRKEK